MEYVSLGRTGLQVSRIALGCMSYGDPHAGNHEWTLDEEASRPFIRQALEAGITFFDTANVYSAGTSEEIVGRALAEMADRDDVVIATKVHGRMRPGPERRGPVAQGDPHRDRPQPAPPRHRLRRPLPDPPVGPAHADRGDDGGAARRRARRQGPLPRRFVDGRLAVRQGPARRRARGLDAVRQHAAALQPRLPRGGARDAAAVRRPGGRGHPVEPARARPADPPVGHRHRAQPHRRVRQDAVRRAGPRHRRDGRGRRRRARREPGAGGAGVGAAAAGRHRARSSARPSRSTSPTPSPPSSCGSATTSWRGSPRPTRPGRSPGTDRDPAADRQEAAVGGPAGAEARRRRRAGFSGCSACSGCSASSAGACSATAC